MSALDGRRKGQTKPFTDEHRRKLSEAARAGADQRRGFVIPDHLKNEAQRVYMNYWNRHGSVIPREVWRAALGLMLLLFVASDAGAHGWYSGKDDPVTGIGCCGGTDCKEIADDGVQETAAGYLYVPTGEVIPYSRAQESRDWRFHRCEFLGDYTHKGQHYKKGSTRCFFRKPGSI